MKCAWPHLCSTIGISFSWEKDLILNNRFVELYNSECDKENPRSVKELVKIASKDEQKGLGVVASATSVNQQQTSVSKSQTMP